MIFITGCGAPVGQTSEYVYTYKLKPCPEINYEAVFLNDTMFALSEGFTYTLLKNDNGNITIIAINPTSNFFTNLSPGNYAIITDTGACGKDTSNFILTGYEINTFSTVCQGASYTFLDGFTLSNITQITNHTSVLLSQNNLDRIVNHVVFPVPAVDTTIIRVEDSLQIANFQTNTTFQWIDCNSNSLIEGATNSSFTSQTTGNYAAIISQEGCIDTTNCYILGSLSVNNLGESSKIHAFPIPSSEYISINNLIEDQLIIQDFNGKVISNENYSISENTINIKKLVPGMYFIKIPEKIIKFIKI
jgi:hypothetical protein